MGATSREWTERIAQKCRGGVCRNVSITVPLPGRNDRNGEKTGREGCAWYPHDERGQTRAQEEEGKLYRRTRIAETRQFVARASVNLLPRSRWLTSVRESRETVSPLSDVSTSIEREVRIKESDSPRPSRIGEGDDWRDGSTLPHVKSTSDLCRARLRFLFLFSLHFTSFSTQVAKRSLNVALSQSSRLYLSVCTDRARHVCRNAFTVK